MRRTALLLLILLTNCKVKTWSSYSSTGMGGGEPDLRKGAYDAPACEPLRKLGTVDGAAAGSKERVYYGEQGRDLDTSLEQQILQLICVHELRQSEATVKQHLSFDDRRYDHLAAALMVVDCEVSRFCDVEERPIAVGMMAWYIANTDMKQLAQALEPLALDARAKTAFLTRATQAARNVQRMVDGLDPRRRELYVKVPDGVRAARRSYFRKHADLYARLDAVVEHAEENRKKQRVTAAIYAALEQLRDEYLTACGKAECRFDPFFTEVTRELALLHLAGRDPVGVLAENELLRENDANRNGYGPAIYRAQVEAMKQEEDAYRRYQRARREGVDEAAIVASFGGTPPVDVSPSAAWYADAGFPDFAAAVRDDKYTSVTGTIKSTVPGKGITRLVLDYDDAIYVPNAEAEHIKAGESCRAVVDRANRDGLIVACSLKNRITQLRKSRI